jgi:hypothetical protein
VGFSSGPDQFLFGGQLVIGEIAPSLTFDPSLDIGMGDHQTVVGLHFDLHYHFDTRTTWRPYAGAGATLNFVSYDHDRFGDKSSDTFAGGNLVLGAGAPTSSGNRIFTELDLGLGDTADLRLLVGWNFKL